MQALAPMLQAMTSAQLLMALVFVAGYVLSLGGLLPSRTRSWSLAVTGAAALGFVALAPDWVTALMLLVLAIGLLAVFIALTWVLSAAAAWARRSTDPARFGSTLTSDLDGSFAASGLSTHRPPVRTLPEPGPAQTTPGGASGPGARPAVPPPGPG